MGTNYYVKEVDGLHIGKSSAGWCFALHVYPDNGISDLKDWEPIFASEPIVDEYGRSVSNGQMMKVITNRTVSPNKNGRLKIRSDDFHDRNVSEEGPNGLVRCRVGVSCLSHGSGTWDCVVGDFS